MCANVIEILSKVGFLKFVVLHSLRAKPQIQTIQLSKLLAIEIGEQQKIVAVYDFDVTSI